MRKSGASRADILLQFLTEAVTLCVIGGIGGVLVGALASGAVRRLLGMGGDGIAGCRRSCGRFQRRRRSRRRHLARVKASRSVARRRTAIRVGSFDAAMRRPRRRDPHSPGADSNTPAHAAAAGAAARKAAVESDVQRTELVTVAADQQRPAVRAVCARALAGRARCRCRRSAGRCCSAMPRARVERRGRRVRPVEHPEVRDETR